MPNSAQMCLWKHVFLYNSAVCFIAFFLYSALLFWSFSKLIWANSGEGFIGMWTRSPFTMGGTLPDNKFWLFSLDLIHTAALVSSLYTLEWTVSGNCCLIEELWSMFSWRLGNKLIIASLFTDLSSLLYRFVWRGLLLSTGSLLTGKSRGSGLGHIGTKPWLFHFRPMSSGLV